MKIIDRYYFIGIGGIGMSSLAKYLLDIGSIVSGYDKTIMSVKGRATLFPAYFTHTHKGHICPEKKDRYIITGYVNFVRRGEGE